MKGSRVGGGSCGITDADGTLKMVGLGAILLDSDDDRDEAVEILGEVKVASFPIASVDLGRGSGESSGDKGRSSESSDSSEDSEEEKEDDISVNSTVDPVWEG